MRPTSHAGFTLIEIIIGIVILSISLGIITTFFVNQSKQSADPIHQVRATELAQAVINEIFAKAFDENSDHAGGVNRCTAATCTAPASLGAEEARVDLYDDVDDYVSTGAATCNGSPESTIQDVLADTSIASEYSNYCLSIDVFYDGNRDGVDDAAYADAKRIVVTIVTPSGSPFNFAVLRYNY